MSSVGMCARATVGCRKPCSTRKPFKRGAGGRSPGDEEVVAPESRGPPKSVAFHCCFSGLGFGGCLRWGGRERELPLSPVQPSLFFIIQASLQTATNQGTVDSHGSHEVTSASHTLSGRRALSGPGLLACLHTNGRNRLLLFDVRSSFTRKAKLK